MSLKFTSYFSFNSKENVLRQDRKTKREIEKKRKAIEESGEDEDSGDGAEIGESGEDEESRDGAESGESGEDEESGDEAESDESSEDEENSDHDGPGDVGRDSDYVTTDYIESCSDDDDYLYALGNDKQRASFNESVVKVTAESSVVEAIVMLDEGLPENEGDVTKKKLSRLAKDRSFYDLNMTLRSKSKKK